MSTPFRPIQIPPGVVSMPTKNMSSSNWCEVNMFRWVEGRLTPIGGQVAYNYTFASRCRAIHGWYDLAGVYHIAYLCEQNLYVDTGGVLTDISPTPSIPAPPVPSQGGYGDSNYNTGNYNQPRTIPIQIAMDKVPNAFSLDNFGSVLYAMVSYDGRLLMWDPAVGGAAVVQPAASGRGPVPNGRCFVVTSQRFIQIFGSYNDGTTGGGGPRRFAWCDQENPGAWDYSNVTSQAGFLDIEPASPIITAIATRYGTLFWTSKKVYVSQFLGIPYVYNDLELGDGTTPWSPESMVNTSLLTLWMSEQGLFSYDGTSVMPVPCRVRPWIDNNIDPLYVREESCAVHVAGYNEFWWFFPTLNSTTNTRGFIYNYKEGWASQVRMARSAGVTSSYSSHTIMADGTTAYEHEVGQSYPTDVSLPFAETFDLNLSNGARLVTVKQLLPDLQVTDTNDPNAVQIILSNLQYSLFYRNSRSLGAPEIQTPVVAPRSDGYVDLRTTGRDMRLRIAVGGPQVAAFTMGQHSIDWVLRGDR